MTKEILGNYFKPSNINDTLKLVICMIAGLANTKFRDYISIVSNSAATDH